MHIPDEHTGRVTEGGHPADFRKATAAPADQRRMYLPAQPATDGVPPIAYIERGVSIGPAGLKRHAALRAACELADQGYACFPCLENKAPACPGGFKAATAVGDRLIDVWGQHPGSLVGVATGERSGIDVLDLDPRHGAGQWWAEHRDRLPQTRTHRTRSGGLHLLFRHAPGLRNSAGRLAPGCDVRAEGGYVIWWPAAGLPVLSDAVPAAWDEWLLQQLVAPATTAQQEDAAGIPPVLEHPRGYALAALRRAVQRVATASPGSRNSILNAECFRLARFVPARLGGMEVARAMAAAARIAGLDSAETERTIASALRAGGVA